MVFDFYGTLARALRFGPRFEEVLARFGLTLDEAHVDAWRRGAADGSDHARHSADRASYVAWEHERLRAIAAACGAADDDEVASALYAALKDYELAAYDEVPGVLAALGASGLALGICSNWDWDLDRAVAGVGLDGYFEVTVTSARAGARKPHRRILELTLDALGASPAEVLFVGDTWGADVEGPIAAGMTALHLWRDDAPPGDPPPLVPGSHRATDLRGVLDLV